MKNIILLMAVLVISTVNTNAQFRWLKNFPLGSNNEQMVVGVNMEQLLTKIGEAKLIELLTINDRHNNDKGEKQTKKAIAIKRAFAALYGAGIDFSKKMWVVPNPLFTKKPTSEWMSYGESYSATIIPIKNKQVVLENIAIILDKNNEEAIVKKEYNDVTYFTGKEMYNNTLVVVTNNEIIIANTPYADVNDFNFYGRTVKVDTTIDSEVKKYTEDIITEKAIKADYPIIEIDQWKNGLIKRVYVNKETAKPKYNHKEVVANDTAIAYYPPVLVEEAVTTPAAAVPVEATQAPVADIAAIPAEYSKTEINEVIRSKKDTLTRTEYVDGKMLTIHYIPFTDTEREIALKDREELRMKNKEELINKFIQNHSSLFIFNNATQLDIAKAVTAPDDLVILSTMSLSNSLGTFKNILHSPNNTSAKTDINSFNSVSTINFENGLINGKFQTGCCNENGKLITNMYNPITNFMPSILGVNKYGSMRYNVNITNALQYIKSGMPNEAKLEQSLAEVGMQVEDFDKMFTGEIALTIGTQNREKRKERVEPTVALALKLKDAKLAVTKMNQIGSKSLKQVPYYRFAENGEYIVFSSIQFFEKKLVPEKVAVQSLGNFGEMQLDLKGFLKAMFSNKNENELKQMMDVFGKMNVVNNKTEEGKFITDFTMEMGDKNKNALVSYVDLMLKATESVMDRRAEVIESPAPAVSTYNARKVTKRGTPTTKRKTTIKKK